MRNEIKRGDERRPNGFTLAGWRRVWRRAMTHTGKVISEYVWHGDAPSSEPTFETDAKPWC